MTARRDTARLDGLARTLTGVAGPGARPEDTPRWKGTAGRPYRPPELESGSWPGIQRRVHVRDVKIKSAARRGWVTAGAAGPLSLAAGERGERQRHGR
jgi:hypothetical protein